MDGRRERTAAWREAGVPTERPGRVANPSAAPRGRHPSGAAACLAARGARRSDSLSWFALRHDRTVIFSPSRKAAVSHRIVGGVSLAAGDPVGDPEAWPGAISAWVEEAEAHGWLPGVLGTSEQGAQAHHRAGLDALELGDEAILRTADFTTEGRRMRVVRQAVSRCRRAGLRTTCCRVRDLDEATRATVVRSAEAWRDGALGVARVSLNFAVFRSVFTRGERLGAGPVLRLWRFVLPEARALQDRAPVR
ncbi:DUF2156 domain-containing protein [Nocardioides panacis]|uniref:DUF2156 domain-containing protein n=1 Tax=Nocardioides panacis TaxID=2849501 RepID=A0A975Y208_9ACTN|nr:phosphatidylglycerol lysyltransferase domain-containing protein [Nocardioides panacis]QWZ09964.1 DUF2156 domain-containing protein [Nocardioides panacis]